MAYPRALPKPIATAVFAFAFSLLALVGARPARAGRNDLQLLNLCPLHTPAAGVLGGPVQECKWIDRDPTTGATRGVIVDSDAQARFRSLMSELGVVVAPRLVTPADTLGFAGFQFSAELGVTQISASRDYWDGVAAVNPGNRTASRPDSYLTTVGGFARKGLWLPVPALELGGGFVNVLGSSLFALQAYAKIGLQEGFHGWALPSVAVRGAVSQLVGTDQVDMTVSSVDVIISKAFSVGGTARFEPFLGWNMLFIDARSGVIDATPACDAFALHATAMGATLPPNCPARQAGTWDDLNANFTFPRQDVITRQRLSGGFKMKLAVLFLAAAYEITPAGHSNDQSRSNGAQDQSQTQQSFSLSAGFDF
ncbi:MAG TPA: hypothetical protein VH374_03405 [Polyangia bacterium]|jgi:hypothetical protein|nr:hypothetical protein [Polyangia bacterium]